MRFDLVDLRVFLHVCETGSMTAAGERAHLTLAAVSARMRALEDSLGMALLARHARGVTATAAGEALARHARLVLHQLGALERDLGRPAPPAPSQAVLLANSSALARPLAGVLAGVLQARPGARISVRESPSEVTVHALRIGAADVGIVGDSVSTAGLEAADLGPDPLVLVVPSRHALAGSGPTGLRQVLAHDWVGWDEAGALHTHLAMHAFRLGGSLRCRATHPESGAVLDMVARGVGISVLPARLVPAGQPAGALATVALTDGWAQRRLLVCRDPARGTDVGLALARAIQAHWTG